MQEFLSQGSNLHHSSDLSHSNDNAGSLTCWATRNLLSSKFFPLFSLFSFWDPIVWMLECSMLSQRSLKSHYLKFLLFAVVIGWFPLFCLPCHLSFLVCCIICYWLPLVNFTTFTVFFISDWFFSCFSLSFCWISHWVPPFFSWVQWASLWPFSLNSLIGKEKENPVSLHFFSRLLLCSFLWNIWLCFLICLTSGFISMS